MVKRVYALELLPGFEAPVRLKTDEKRVYIADLPVKQV